MDLSRKSSAYGSHIRRVFLMQILQSFGDLCEVLTISCSLSKGADDSPVSSVAAPDCML